MPERKRETGKEPLTLGEQGTGGWKKKMNEEVGRAWGERVCILEDFLELITPTIINVA